MSSGKYKLISWRFAEKLQSENPK